MTLEKEKKTVLSHALCTCDKSCVCVYISFTDMIKHFIYSKSDQSKTIKGTKGAGSFVVLSQFLYLYVKRK